MMMRARVSPRGRHSRMRGNREAAKFFDTHLVGGDFRTLPHARRNMSTAKSQRDLHWAMDGILALDNPPTSPITIVGAFTCSR